MKQEDRPHTWTLPLSPYRWGYLQLPARTITEAEWEQLEVLLAVFKPGLIALAPEPDAFPVDEALVSAAAAAAPNETEQRQ